MTDADRLRESVREAYSAAAALPEGKHPFPVGVAFALSLGYPRDLLDSLPVEAAAAFAGVSNVAVEAPIEPGMRVVDLGCGAGLDSLIAARRAGGGGLVVGFDFSAEMLERAAAARRSSVSNACFARAAAESLPLPDAYADLALINGIFNLNPYRREIFRELARIVKPGGGVFGAELVLRDALPETLRSGGANWFS